MDLHCVDELSVVLDASAPYVGPESNDALASSGPLEASKAALLLAICRCVDGSSAAVVIEGYRPWVRLMSRGGPTTSVKWLLRDVLGHDVDVIEEMLPKFYGYEGSSDGLGAAKWPCVKVFCPTFAVASRLESIFRYPGFGRRKDLVAAWTLSDVSIPHATRAYNELGIQPCGWIRLDATPSSLRSTTCTRQFSGHVKTLKALENTAIAPVKVMSFDAEMYSNDNCFPDVLHGDFTVAVCATIWSYGSSSLRRHAFLVGHCERPKTDMVVHECSSPADLFEQFRDLVASEDPDLLTGWNIYGFDMPFMWDEYQSAHANPQLRGTEGLHKALLEALGRKGFQSASELGAKPKVQQRWLKNFRTAEFPECIAAPLRAEMRLSKGLGPEPAFGGPDDLMALRALAAGVRLGPSGPSMPSAHERTAALFKTVIDQPRCIGVRRAEFLGRILGRSVLDEKRMSSAAKGDNTYYMWSGRTCVDLMHIIKDDKKLDDNTLKYAAHTFLDPEFCKLDMTPAEMFKAWRTRDAKGLADMLDYCARDADIPILLMQKLSYLPMWVEMSRVTYTPLGAVLNGGQQRRVYNLLAHFVHGTHALNEADSGWPVSDVETDKRRPDYQGATVIEPISGFYTESVSTLDFESLYPSIMRHFNLCPSVYLRPGAEWPTGSEVIETHTIKHSILEAQNKYVDFERQYSFVKNVQGVVPSLLMHLLAARKTAKKAMASAANDFEREVQNGRQLALKVSCNSVYGFFGTDPKKGLMSCKPVAAVTTLRGRAFIEAARAYVEKQYLGSKVLYGDTDSIMIKWGPTTTVPEAYRLADEASAAITELLRLGLVEGASKPLLDSAASSVTLANEKVYSPYLLIQKKNYAGFKYSLMARHSPQALEDFETCIDMKGIDAVRRDRSKLVKIMSNAVLDALLVRRSLDAAVDVLRNSLDAVAGHTAPLDWFVLSKSLKSNYASENQPHVQAWKRMAARGETVPEVGSRMPYVIITGSAKALYERTEHPDWVVSAKLAYCAKYYLENAQDVIERLLGPTGLGARVKDMFESAIARAEQKSAGTMSLMRFKKTKLT